MLQQRRERQCGRRHPDGGSGHRTPTLRRAVSRPRLVRLPPRRTAHSPGDRGCPAGTSVLVTQSSDKAVAGNGIRPMLAGSGWAWCRHPADLPGRRMGSFGCGRLARCARGYRDPEARKVTLRRTRASQSCEWHWRARSSGPRIARPASAPLTVSLRELQAVLVVALGPARQAP